MRLTLMLLSLTVGSAFAATLKPYGNARFNYWAHVPADLVAQPPPENGDGQGWKSRDGKVDVRVWGSYGPEVLDRADVRSFAAWNEKSIRDDGGRITYKRLLTDAFVLSGYRKDGRIFYQKTLVKDGTEATVLIEYPVTQRALWDKLSGQIAATLKWGQR